ncbi:MAG: DUF3794 domain-containing protein [Anaeromicrobium sp.]|jgi:hypothetical protein|uniref:DUF3794 and LysM peptidoglycan-binding domain-containing protein n=1 Tax=Anaeromicrobium sp. TaxID=1929132 RepID=UPI0025CD7869|nr:SPOCS domain-containing protein [Anaeromicrobium sp.]MCT4593279.1 DUF3794 domain-containing protein [Anaeromicrobium sp.]
MAMEFITDLLKIDQILGEGDTQVLVEGDILVPDVKPDISNILCADGDVIVTKRESVQDKIIVDGVVNFKILYKSDGGDYSVYSMNASAGFSQNIDIPGTAVGMNEEVSCHIEHIDFDIINERKLSVKAVVNIDGKTLSSNRIEVIKDISGLSDLQTLKKTISYTNMVGSNKSDTMIREKFELDGDMAEIGEILKCDAYAVEKERQVTDGKVIVSGTVKTNTLYVADDESNSLHVLKHEIPFTHFVEVSGALKGMEPKLTLKIDEVYTDVGENLEGERKLYEMEAVVKVDASVIDKEEKEVITDVYSPTKNLKLEKEKVDFYKVIGENNASMMVKETLSIDPQDPDIFKVLNVYGKPVITDLNVVDDKVIIEGIAQMDIVYMCQNQKAHSFKQEIPFRHFVDVPKAKEGMDATCYLTLTDVSYSLVNPQQMEVRMGIMAMCGVNHKYSLDAVMNMEELEEKDHLKTMPSIIVYYVQPGDSLWKIAKRYNTTIPELVKSNEIEDPNMIMPGERLIIPKIYKYEF